MRGHPVAFFSKKKIIPQTTFVPTFWPHIISELGGVNKAPTHIDTVQIHLSTSISALH